MLPVSPWKFIGQRIALLPLVGLAEVEVKEARERVRAAIVNAGLEFPNNKRITVNLAPADLPILGALICPLRWVFWRPAARSMRLSWPIMSLRESYR
ncbi:hypothetical protein J4714_14695 [Staphylococcus epidermidis]|nr:hypothetical protein [Staphylococcus epidermidis]